MHTALTGIAGCRRLVHKTLLDDGAVDSEAERRGRVWCSRSSGFDEGLEDVVLQGIVMFLVGCLTGLYTYIHTSTMYIHRG